MNNNQRNNFEEELDAERTAQVLEAGHFETAHFETAEESQTAELGRLLRQSAEFDLPESNDALREQLLMELSEGEAPVAPMKTVSTDKDYQVSRKRMWMGLAAGAMIATGGWFMYSNGSFSMAQLNWKAEQPNLMDRAKAAERQVNVAVMDTPSSLPPGLEGSAPADSIEFRYEANPIADQEDSPEPYHDAPGAPFGNDADSDSKWVKNTPSANPVDNGKDIALLQRVGKSADRSGRINEKIVADQLRGVTAGPVKAGPGTDGRKQSGPQQGQQDQQLAKLYSMLDLQEGQKQDGKGQGQWGYSQQRAWKAEASKKSNSDNNFFVTPGQPEPASKPMPGGNGRGGGLLGGGGGGGGLGGGGGGLAGGKANGKSLGLPSLNTPTHHKVIVSDGSTVLIGGVKPEEFKRYESKTQSLGEDRYYRFSEDLDVAGEGGEQYAPIHENLFVQATGGSAISTFSIDVDTASYANMRRFLNSGQRPPRDSVRIEELVNYFQYDYPQPKGEDPFSVNMELATCPWNEAHKLLRVGLKGKEVHVDERPPTNVVYLIDVSGSMNSADKLPLLKSGFQMMTKQLGENDRVSIVTYAGSAGVALEPTTGEKTKTITEAIERLTPGGSTHGSAGIELAYNLAQKHFITGGVNKVILATDGDLNVGVTSDDSLVKLIKQKASEGVFLTVLGFGTGNLKDGKLEKLADNGNGHYSYIDSNREAHRVLVQQMSGSLVTIAKDVKIQIEFNPAEVSSYRLIGYENRMLATKDFADDRKDAGEIGAGHTVTAIYEIEPTGGAADAFTAPAGMKYQAAGKVKETEEEKQPGLTEAAESGELATVALRYKKPDENKSKRIEFAIKNQEKSFGTASEDFRFAASVAGFGMLLRGSEHSGAATAQSILEMASESIGDDPSGYRAEFVDLIRKASYGQ